MVKTVERPKYIAYVLANGMHIMTNNGNIWYRLGIPWLCTSTIE